MVLRSRCKNGSTGSLLSKVSDSAKSFFRRPVAYEQRLTSATAPSYPAANAAVESLEGRTLFAYISYTNDVVTLHGDASAANNFAATLSADGKVLSVSANNARTSFAAHYVKSIRVLGGNLADSADVSNSIKIPATLEGNGGNDTLRGGGGNDVIYGHAGDDTLDGRDGNDALFGNDGNDTLTGGAGSNNLDGGAGSNTLNGASSGGSTGTANTGTTTPTGTPTLAGWSLINADTGAVIQTISEQATIDLAKLPTRNLNIAPNASGAIGSVKFSYNGNSNYRTDNDAPFNLFAAGTTPATGKHSITATAFSGDNASGSYQTKAVVNFSFTDSGGGTTTPTTPTTPPPTDTSGTPRLAGWSIVNASTGAVIQTISEQQTIDLAKLPTRNINLVPTASGPIGSVKFVYDTNNNYHTDNDAPFTLSPTGLTPSLGKHTVQALAYSGDNASGSYQTKAILNFYITDSGSTGGTPSGGGTTTPPPTTTDPTTPSTDANAPRPVITFIDNTEMAGSSVHVHALATSLSSGDPVRTRYQWDFGDPGSAHNTLTGFNAAHIYDRAGTYTVTLTVTDNQGRTSIARSTVTISADTRRKVYVSSAGNDANNGSSEGAAVKTIARANQLIAANTEVLFRRGDSFDTSVPLTVGANNVLIGAYGSGNRPTLANTVAMTDIIRVDIDVEDVTVQDLNFDSRLPFDTNKTSASRALTPGGTSNAIRNCTFTNVSDAINLNANPRGVLVQDNSDTSDTSVRGYLVWVQGSDITLLGNTTRNSTREHAVRVGGVTRLTAYGNDLTSISRQAQGDGADIAKGTFVLQSGDYVYVANNTVKGGGIGVGPLGGPDGVSDAGARMKNVVVEANRVIDISIGVNPGVEHVVLRNNVISRNVNEAITVVPQDLSSSAYAARTITDLLIVNNTAINTNRDGRFLYLYKGATNGQITMNNNLFVAPNLLAGTAMNALVYVDGPDLGSFKEITNNVWATPATTSYAGGGYFYVYSYWSDPKGYIKPDAWNNLDKVGTDQFEDTVLTSTYTPGVSSKAATGGKKTDGVFTDFYGKIRPNTSIWSAGAVQI